MDCVTISGTEFCFFGVGLLTLQKNHYSIELITLRPSAIIFMIDKRVENQEFSNLYEVVKTVRFELKPSKKMDFKNGDVSLLLTQFQNIQQNFLDFIVDGFQKDKDNFESLNFKKKRKIKYDWLRVYTKNDFYSWDKKSKIEKSYTLTEINFIEKECLRWLNEWQKLTQDLDDNINTSEQKQSRKSQIAFILRNFSKRQNFNFIKDFFNSLVDIQNKQGNEVDEQIKIFKIELSKIEQNFKSCLNLYLPSQSNGVLLHKASLNYYTLNKTPREYEKLKKNKELEMGSKLPWFIFQRSQYNSSLGKKEIVFDCNKNWLNNIKLGEDIYDWTLDEAYQKLKIWKANQKSKFIEKVKNEDLQLENFKKEFPLFDSSDDNFRIFSELTEELNSLEGEAAKKKAKERGRFFNTPKEKRQTKNYCELCELYKRIAQKRGKIIAEIKGIENEQVQSQTLTHWALMSEKNDIKQLVLIPKILENDNENHKNAHKELNKIQNEQKKSGVKSGDITLYHFKSLTLRALEKLCFKEVENTFKEQMIKEGIKVKFTEVKNSKSRNYNEYPTYKQVLNDEQIIDFYIQVLNSKYARKYLDLTDFGGLEQFLLDSKSITDLEKFRSDLEKVCYTKILIYFSTDEFAMFRKNFSGEIFEINTRSISSESERKENVHAKIWNKFWSPENNNYITRLNPELQIFYRDRIEDKDNSTRGGNKSKVNNRFSAPRYTLATTISLNATYKKTDLAFKTIDEVKNHVDKFNEDFNSNFTGEWYFGIDRGIKELATLCVVKFAKEKNDFEVSKHQEFAEIPVYKLIDEKADLKDDNGVVLKNIKGENRKIIDNISEVLKENVEPDPQIFNKEIVSCVDLTQAKLIKGHIILNGDQKTYLKLKELSAKRRIFELFSTKKIDRNISFVFGKTVDVVGINYKYTVYWLNEKQKGNQEVKQKLEEELNNYLQNLDLMNKESDIETIEKINHLRDAITANMIGIIYYLQNQLRMKGRIGLENLDTFKIEKENRKKETGENDSDLGTGREVKMIDGHFDQSNQDISRRLEWSLYRKFATTGEVPSQIKESILLRDEFKIYQVGILNFVEVGGTSSNCPNCGNIVGKANNKTHFVCKDTDKKPSCGFSTNKSNEGDKDELEKRLTNSDEVAAYNIAKNAFDKIYTR